MKIVPFRRPDNTVAIAEQVDAALSGEASGPEAESWRELRADVRELAPPMSPELERELWTRIEARSALRPRRAPVRLLPRAVLARFNAWLASGLRARLLAATGVSVTVAIVALAILAPWQGVRTGGSVFERDSTQPARQDELGPAEGPIEAAAQPRSSSAAASAASAVTKAESSQLTPFAKAPSSEAHRVQQLGASLTLAPKPEAVESVADEVAQLAEHDGGFVESSQVRIHGRSGEASLTLSLPSARLSASLASLGQLAPMRAENQTLQDITDVYDADRTKLADAVAERQALLRALAKAGTQGEIESLHARLALAAGAITRARGEYQAVSKRASNSSVEVTVLGDTHTSDSRSTLGTGLHEAGDVLEVALAVVLVALAVLVPLSILLALLVLGLRMTRRRLRERALS